MIRWTRKTHEAMVPEAEQYHMDVYHLLHVRYNASVVNHRTVAEFYSIIEFYDSKREALFRLRYGDVL